MPEDEGITEDNLLFAGWIVVRWEEGDEDEGVEYTRDFCSRGCAGRWLLKEDMGGKADSSTTQEGPQKQGGGSV